MKPEIDILETDILIIGGGTAGCYSALTIAENSDYNVIIAEKANIKRSGCLAAGVNALNAYIVPGETVESYVEYVKKEFEGVIREDLTYSIGKSVNKVTEKLQQLGLPILKDEKGNYATRNKRSIKINGENIKPIFAEAVSQKKSITVLNRVNIIDYLIKDNQIVGAVGFSVNDEKYIVIYAKAIICSTGGASGLYSPNNPGFSKHKMWYCPFNTGTGYAIGIRAGAEMTSFEMRFIALRCKNTIAPTGTIAQGIKAAQINAKGEEYSKKDGSSNTSMRLWSTILENLKGNGPCYLKTQSITKDQEQELFKAYLNMSPAQTLKWIENDAGPSCENAEIEGTEPYITGGHTGSGYWIDTNRKTTLPGLWAIGDAAGGSPKKYVTGCLVEGEISALSVIESIKGRKLKKLYKTELNKKIQNINEFFKNAENAFTIESIEEMMQETMDKYAGGISTNYIFNEERLKVAEININYLLYLARQLKANDFHELMIIHEIIDRLYVCKVLICHLQARKETRWKCYQENADYPQKDDKNWLKYVNSRYKNGEIEIIFRDLVKMGNVYEH